MIHGKYEIELNRKRWEDQRSSKRKFHFWLIALVVFGPLLWVLLRGLST